MSLLLDTHAHFYPCYDQKVWLDSLFHNFLRHKKNYKNALCGVILTERSSENYFQKWQQSKEISGYKITPLSEKAFVVSDPQTSEAVCIYAGRQIKTSEKLEVLCLSSSASIPDGLSLIKTTQSLLDAGEIVVIPWSFGKWIGKRRKKVTEALSHLEKNIFIGDIFGRPQLDNLEALSNRTSNLLLYGTDPLPHQSEASLVATKITVFPNYISSELPLFLTSDLFKSFEVTTASLQNESLLNIFYRQLKLAVG